jgi:hypothetical protein
MFRFIFKKSNTIDFNKTLSKGSFGFLKAEKTLYFLYNFFIKILFFCFLDIFFINVNIQPSLREL